MSAPQFFDLQATHNPHRWYLPLTPAVCVVSRDNLFMFGGVGMASAITALERTCERPVIWATAQYLSYARPGSVLEVDVRLPVPTGSAFEHLQAPGSRPRRLLSLLRRHCPEPLKRVYRTWKHRHG